MSDLLDRVPPHNERMETGLCACAFVSIHTVDFVANIVSPDDFYVGDCRAIWRAILALREAGDIVDAKLLEYELHNTGVIINYDRLADILASEITMVHCVRYAEIIHNLARRRKIAAGSLDVQNITYDTTVPIADINAMCEAMAEEGETNREIVSSDPAMDRTLEQRKSGSESGIECGFASYDTEYGGMKAGQLIILAGTTGSGKSALALQVAEHVATGQNIIYFSLEMSVEELTERRIKRSPENLEKLRSAKLWIYDSAVTSVEEIAIESRSLKQRDGLGLIVVDYLQLLKPTAEGKQVSREKQVASIARGLKRVAREVKIPVLCLCQLNRKADEADEPKLHHLRESGAIEHDADVVILINRKEGSNDNSGVCNMIIAKHRRGRPKTISMAWEGEKYEFTEAEWGGGVEFDADDHSFGDTEF